MAAHVCALNCSVEFIAIAKCNVLLFTDGSIVRGVAKPSKH